MKTFRVETFRIYQFMLLKLNKPSSLIMITTSTPNSVYRVSIYMQVGIGAINNADHRCFGTAVDLTPEVQSYNLINCF